MAIRKFHCNCCGTDFEEPDGMYEKLRCPNCDAIREDDDGEMIEEMEEQ